MDERQQRAIAEFEMPTATIGLPVIWYPTGRLEKKRAHVAYMIQCGARTVTLQIPNGRVDAVRHVGDPKLDLSVDQREQGAWDFTDDWKEMQEFKAQVNARLAGLEKDTTKIVVEAAKQKKRSKPAVDKFEGYRRLKDEAKELGVDMSRSMKKADLAKAIADKKAADAIARAPSVIS